MLLSIARTLDGDARASTGRPLPQCGPLEVCPQLGLCEIQSDWAHQSYQVLIGDRRDESSSSIPGPGGQQRSSLVQQGDFGRYSGVSVIQSTKRKDTGHAPTAV